MFLKRGALNASRPFLNAKTNALCESGSKHTKFQEVNTKCAALYQNTEHDPNPLPILFLLARKPQRFVHSTAYMFSNAAQIVIKKNVTLDKTSHKGPLF